MMMICYHQGILTGVGVDVAKPSVNYLSYLLRLWRTGEHSVWKASLEDPQTGELLGFADLALLFAFLRDKAWGTDSADKSGGYSGSSSRQSERD